MSPSQLVAEGVAPPTLNINSSFGQMKILSSAVFCVALLVLRVITNGLRDAGMEYTVGAIVVGLCDGDVGITEGAPEG